MALGARSIAIKSISFMLKYSSGGLPASACHSPTS
jgi:hypothetical protein